MSNLNIATLPRMTALQLRTLLASPATAQTLAIIDVRDADYLGGHIAGSTNIPTSSHDVALPELARTLADKKTVVFHCMLSQQRGPSAALKYARARERLLREAPGGGKVAVEGTGDVEAGQQKVAILTGGFEGWVRAGYWQDPKLTEGFVQDLWEGELD